MRYLKVKLVFYLLLFSFLVGFSACKARNKVSLVSDNLRFIKSDSGAFRFNTGEFKGVFRKSGKSIGLVPVLYNGSTEIASGAGLFNHYRVFTQGKRYGYGARRWASTAKLHPDGSVEVTWSRTTNRPFELRGKYCWITPNTLDVLTTVLAAEKLVAFEVFLASYFDPTFIDSHIWASSNLNEEQTASFVSAERELGAWLAFPRDKMASEIINDGRWTIEPHPLEWTIMPSFKKPLAIRRDPISGITVLLMTKHKDCFGVFTPYNKEKHFSNYFSLFGYDIKAGETAYAHSRMVVLVRPTDKEILEVASLFFD